MRTRILRQKVRNKMKLEIEILKEEYEFIKKKPSAFVVMNYPLLMSDICERIKNGTPLLTDEEESEG
jgi:hypothetical protein